MISYKYDGYTVNDWDYEFYASIRDKLDKRDYFRSFEVQQQLDDYNEMMRQRMQKRRIKEIQYIKDCLPKVGVKIKIIYKQYDNTYNNLIGIITYIDDNCYIHGTWGNRPLNPYFDNWIRLDCSYPEWKDDEHRYDVRKLMQELQIFNKENINA